VLEENSDECRPVFSMTAFQWFLINIWRLRTTYPQKDILFHADNINAAFCRILYAPDMAIIFAYVFGPYVIVPVGMVFGARLAQLFFSMASNIRADIARTGDLHLHQPLHLLT
jgi:xanthine/uracil permease